MDKAIKAALCCMALMLQPAIGRASDAQSFDVKSRQISQFHIGSKQVRFGPLEFVGGLEMIGASRDFGGWSGIAIADDAKSFVGVADTGFWITGQIKRDANGIPQGITAQMRPIDGKDGKPIGAKWRADAEGIALKGNKIFASFERVHRVAIYQNDPQKAPKLEREFPPPVPLDELRGNAGFEGIAFARQNSDLKGALVGISERSLDKNENIIAFVQPENGKAFTFSVERSENFDVTDLAFLPGGDLIVLERRFNPLDGMGMRLRKFASADIKPGATIKGETLLLADARYQIDNMEGLDITVDADGTPRLTIVSDDNHTLLQRNLLLEFRLTGEATN